MPPRTLVLASKSPARRALLEAAGFGPRVVDSGVDEDGVHGLSAVETACILAERKAVAVAEALAESVLVGDRVAGSGTIADTTRDRVPGPGTITDASATGAGDTPAPAGASGDRLASPAGASGDRLASPAGASGDRLAGPGDPAPLVIGCDSVLDFGGEVRGKPSSAAEATAWWRGYRGRQGTLVSGHALIDLATGRRATAAAQTVVRFGRPRDEEIDAYVATGEPLAVAGGFTLDGYAAPFVDGIDGDHGTVLGLSLPLFRTLLARLDLAVTDLWVVG